MKEDDIPLSVRCIVPFAGWMSRHPKLTNLIIVIELLALAYVAFTYDFTTNF